MKTLSRRNLHYSAICFTMLVLNFLTMFVSFFGLRRSTQGFRDDMAQLRQSSLSASLYCSNVVDFVQLYDAQIREFAVSMQKPVSISDAGESPTDVVACLGYGWTKSDVSYWLYRDDKLRDGTQKRTYLRSVPFALLASMTNRVADL